MIDTPVFGHSPVVAEETLSTSPYPISWEDFEKQYLVREDSFKYEWVRGMVVKTPRDMNQYQYYILDNLMEIFNQMRFENKVSGRLFTEIDTFFLKKTHRRPDMAWFNDEQVARMAYRQNQIPKFVIEIVSDNDLLDNFLDKLKDYRDANVEAVWVISPNLEQVHIFTQKGNVICTGDMPCSATPALPSFQMTANEIFAKPPLPE